MNIALALPDYLSRAQRDGIADLVTGMEFLPISCLFHRGDEPRVISPNRVIPDDFIYMPTNGRLDCDVDGVRQVIRPGEFMMVPAGMKHGVTMAEGVESYEVFALHMHLYDETRHRFLRKMNSSYGSLSEIRDWVPRLSACVCMMGRDPAVGGALMEQLAVSLLIEQLLRGGSVTPLPVKMDERISRLLARIRTEPAEDWTVTRMAQVSCLSLSRFRQLFVESTGTSPKKYVQHVRLSLARSLLVTMPSLTVEQIADRVGITDAHYFHAIYKARFGETPKNRSPYQSDQM